jgi:2-polyprenyl-3-methyl-5-hydroxy-6-metoxy-1,4-benzoquinol methylase
MADELSALFAEVDRVYATPARDYRGREVDAGHVRRYLARSHHRTLEVVRLVTSRAPGRVLDVGAGYGFHDILLAQRGVDVTCLELAENVSAYGRMLAARGLPVVEGRLGALPEAVGPESFDTVVLAEVLEHLRVAPARALAELAGVLRPRGRLILTTPNIARWGNVTRLARGRNILEPLPADDVGLEHVTDTVQHLREYTLGEVVDLAEGAGLRVLEARHSLAKDLPPPDERGRLRPLLVRVTKAALAAAPARLRSLLVVVAEKAAPARRT